VKVLWSGCVRSRCGRSVRAADGSPKRHRG